MFCLQTARPVIQDGETAVQMACDLEQVDLNCLGAEAMFTSYDELNKGNDIDKEGLLMTNFNEREILRIHLVFCILFVNMSLRAGLIFLKLL